MRQLALALPFPDIPTKSKESKSLHLTFRNAGIPSPHRHADRFFHISDQWIEFRYRVLSTQGNNCMACGNSWSVGNPLQVDHIKPRSLYPELALDLDNAQVLCRECNMGKGTEDMTDWRRLKPP